MPKTKQKYIYLIILCFYVCIFNTQSQERFSEKQDSLANTKPESIFFKKLYFGVGIGPETGLSLMLPKISYSSFKEWKSIETYYGLEGTMGVIEASWFAFDVLYGIKKSILTFDNSIGIWWYPKVKTSPFGPYLHCTMNPKVGIKFWRLWFKAGPSIFLFQDYSTETKKPKIGSSPQIGEISYNFELLIRL